MFITIQPEVYEDIFYQENIMAAHKIVTHLTLLHPIGYETSTLALRYWEAVIEGTNTFFRKCGERRSSQRARIWTTIKKPIWINLII